MEITSIITTFILIFSALIVIKGLRIVKQSQAMIVERLGKYSKTLEAGINVIIPIIDQPRSVQWRYAVEDGQGRRFVTYKSRDRIDLRETVCNDIHKTYARYGIEAARTLFIKEFYDAIGSSGGSSNYQHIEL